MTHTPPLQAIQEKMWAAAYLRIFNYADISFTKLGAHPPLQASYLSETMAFTNEQRLVSETKRTIKTKQNLLAGREKNIYIFVKEHSQQKSFCLFLTYKMCLMFLIYFSITSFT